MIMIMMIRRRQEDRCYITCCTYHLTHYMQLCDRINLLEKKNTSQNNGFRISLKLKDMNVMAECVGEHLNINNFTGDTLSSFNLPPAAVVEWCLST